MNNKTKILQEITEEKISISDIVTGIRLLLNDFFCGMFILLIYRTAVTNHFKKCVSLNANVWE